MLMKINFLKFINQLIIGLIENRIVKAGYIIVMLRVDMLLSEIPAKCFLVI